MLGNNIGRLEAAVLVRELDSPIHIGDPSSILALDGDTQVHRFAWPEACASDVDRLAGHIVVFVGYDCGNLRRVVC
jgi:hypothetical protein